jgi:hypothetical protein
MVVFLSYFENFSVPRYTVGDLIFFFFNIINYFIKRLMVYLRLEFNNYYVHGVRNQNLKFLFYCGKFGCFCVGVFMHCSDNTKMHHAFMYELNCIFLCWCCLFILKPANKYLLVFYDRVCSGVAVLVHMEFG